jgi:hypothetical protein
VIVTVMQGAACAEGIVRAASPRDNISAMGQFFISVPPEVGTILDRSKPAHQRRRADQPKA